MFEMLLATGRHAMARTGHCENQSVLKTKLGCEKKEMRPNGRRRARRYAGLVQMQLIRKE
jgi:hypothetical protein